MSDSQMNSFCLEVKGLLQVDPVTVSFPNQREWKIQLPNHKSIEKLGSEVSIYPNTQVDDHYMNYSHRYYGCKRYVRKNIIQSGDSANSTIQQEI